MTLINRLTGQEPTPEEWERIKYRAQRILDSPYSSPEQIEWAMLVPGVTIPVSWESTRQIRIREAFAQKGTES